MLIQNSNIMKLYLSSYEYDDFESPKEILQYHKTIIGDRNVMVVDVDKPLIGQKYGYGGSDISIGFICSIELMKMLLKS